MAHSSAVQEQCPICKKLDIKYRKRQAEMDRINRWVRDGQERKYWATIEKCQGEIAYLNMEIQKMEQQRDFKRASLVR